MLRALQIADLDREKSSNYLQKNISIQISSPGVAEGMKAARSSQAEIVEFMTGFVETEGGFWSPLDRKVSPSIF